MRLLKTLAGSILIGGLATAAPAPQILKWKNITFRLSASPSSYRLQPAGLTVANESVSQAIHGSLGSAQIADLDADGWPEVLVRWKKGPYSQGAALYSVNAGKSLSQVGFPEQPQLGNFRLHGRTLIFQDLNQVETHYRLIPGEAIKQLKAEAFQPVVLDFGLPRGFSPQKMNRNIAPAKDFAGFASGRWEKRARLLPGELSLSALIVVKRVVDSQVMTIMDEASQKSADAPAGSPTQQVGDFYLSGMNVDRLEQLGATPLQADFKKFATVGTPAEFSRTCAEWMPKADGESGFQHFLLISSDMQDSSHYSIFLGDGKLGLSKDNYTNPQDAAVRTAYLRRLSDLLVLSGVARQEAEAQALGYFETEKRIAAKKLSPADRRDPNKAFRKMSWGEALAAYPALALPEQLAFLKLPQPESIWVLNPEALAERNTILAEGDWPLLRNNLRLNALLQCSGFLGPKFEEINLAFAEALYGKIKRVPRPLLMVAAAPKVLGHPLSRLYVARYFPAQRRKSVEELLRRVRGEFRRRIQTNAWLQPQTRQQALAKLDAMKVSVGYPDEWIDYSSVTIRADDYLGNCLRVRQFLFQRELARWGKPVSRDHFDSPGSTLPIDINAAYASSNKIEIPAAILQPPFYDPRADMAVNMGSLGATIGHEFTHGFDSSGRLYDAQGNVRDWWAASDARRFELENQKLVDQANAFEFRPKLYLNGPLESGENMADVGGLSLAYAALQGYLQEHPQERKLRDGLTPEQRFFLSWAQLWAEKGNDALFRQTIASDGHAPGRYRQDQAARHEPGFFKAFGIKPGDPLWLEQQKRTRLW